MPSVPPQRRILVTRSRHQSSALAAELEALGCEPILIPTIAIGPPESYIALDGALDQLDAFDWVVFTSANAVEAFRERSLGRVTTRVPRVAAIGPATAEALIAIGLIATLIPPQAVAESLAEILVPRITRGSTRVLLVRAEQARDVLPESLRAAGATLTIAPAYRNLIPEESIPLLRTLFERSANWPDAVTFTSSSTAANLLRLLEAAQVVLPVDGASDRTIVRASIGPITSRTLRELGYPAHVEAPEPTTRALAKALVRHLSEKLELN